MGLFMSNDCIVKIPLQGVTKHEPPVHSLIKSSFMFVETAGMRHAPEILILELFREIFFKKHTGGKAQHLDPAQNNPAYSELEQIVLEATRGRIKKSGKNTSIFYAPAYPLLARNAYLRKQADRVIRDHLLRGPIANYLLGEKADDRDSFISQMLRAFAGTNNASSTDYEGKEILSTALKDVVLEIENEKKAYMQPLDMESAKTHFLEILSGSSIPENGGFGGSDELAKRLSEDLFSICEVEGNFGRIQWLELLKTFLRVATSVWVLSTMRVTTLVRDWSLQVLENGTVVDQLDIEKSIQNRYQDLFHPSSEPTEEMMGHVQSYMRARIEMNILLYLLESVDKNILSGKSSLVISKEGSDHISIHDLLLKFNEFRDEIAEKYPDCDIKQILARTSEKYAAWTNPLKKGQGKNIDEFLRVLRRASVNDPDEGFLLTPTNTRLQSSMVIFPGLQLLNAFIYLADKRKEILHGKREKGFLVLADVEEHFERYGIAFSSSAGAKPKLINYLAKHGLLRGSPDAGNSVRILNPYQIKEHR